MKSRASLLALLLAGPAAAQETGLASWYGEEFAGRTTAAGARYDPDSITVAHRTLPLGSFVEVTALDTGRSIVALVADRGPSRDDRLVDLSRGAARQLGTHVRPVARVRIRPTAASADEAAALRSGREAPPRAEGTPAAASAAVPASPTGRYLVRVATFSHHPRAVALAAALGATLAGSGPLWRVILGPYADPADAQRARDAAARRGYGDAVILAQH